MGFHYGAGQLMIDRPCTSAGASVVVHKLSAHQQAWGEIKSTNPVLRKLSEFKRAYDEPENSLVSGLRTVTDTINSWFDENEMSRTLLVLMRPLLRYTSIVAKRTLYVYSSSC